MSERLEKARQKREERARLVEQNRSVLVKAKAENRDPSAEESAEWDKRDAQINALKAEIDAIEGAEAREARQAELEAEMRATLPTSRGAKPDTAPKAPDQRAEARQRAVHNWMLGGPDALTPEQRSLVGFGTVNATDVPEDLDPQVRAAVAGGRGLRWSLPTYGARTWNPEARRYERELRATDPQSTTGAAGGYSIPDEPMRNIEEILAFVGGVRNSRATVLRTNTGASLPIPTSDDSDAEGEILAENTQTTTVLTVDFGQEVLGAFKYSSKFIKASLEFLQDTSIGNPEAWLARMVAERLGRITNRHFTKGSNSSQPYGVQWAATLGKTVASATAVTFQEVIDLEHAVDPAYRQGGAEFMFHDSTLAALKKLGDATGQWIWQPGLLGNAPDRILGYPYVINQHMDTMAAGKHSMLFGDFSKYYIRDVREVLVMRLVERFADYGQVAFIAFSRHDGGLVNTSAVKYLRHPAS